MLPIVHLVRHGETEWSLSGRHTGRTDIPLTANGERDGERLDARLWPLTPAQVWCSTSSRARRTAELAGFSHAEPFDDLREWDYGELEGLTTAEYRLKNPDFALFRDGGPGGESMADIAARADGVIARLRALTGDTLIFSHGHFLRVLAARWIDLPGDRAANLFLSTAAVSALGYEHTLERPAIRLWNDTGHLGG